ncbi:endo alpha-1,4 polygalactosaminidase [Spirochaeta cellobiosiphila]|uniref:endo alpha-1,4 polygalactosaminidase n=1 Tax=Spirochaeta cellobiosiphila TaxID=504483 RepID=UPI000410D5CA|nr:endo alpha-1,4 polygalactosaminidase [Spirochaeta cellobiosiphila]
MKRQFITLGLCGLFFMASCQSHDSESSSALDNPESFRQAMRDFVEDISLYGRSSDSDFIVIPQNGHELLVYDNTTSADKNYTQAIDGVGREDLFYGYENDDEGTPTSDREEMITYMDIAKSQDIIPLVTDYVSTTAKIDDSYAQNNAKGYLSFAADHRELDHIPSYPVHPYKVNSNDITSLGEAKNFLYLLNPTENSAFTSKSVFLDALANTNYDVIIMDLFYDGSQDTELSASEINSLKTKANGGKRLVIAYMSIGEAEDYRYYWKSSWSSRSPLWLDKENPDWKGNYKVRYWSQDWQSIIYGDSDAYLDKILAASFDGVYLDIIDAYEHFED